MLRLHIWHAYSTKETLSKDTKVNDLVTMTVTFILKIANFGLCCHVVHVSQTHQFLFNISPKTAGVGHAFQVPGLQGEGWIISLFHPSLRGD